MKHLHTSLDTLFKPVNPTFTSSSLPSGPTVSTRMSLTTIKSSRCAWQYHEGKVTYVILPLDAKFSFSTPKPLPSPTRYGKSVFYQAYMIHIGPTLYFRSEDEAYLQCYLYKKYVHSSKLVHLQTVYPEYFI